jgi:hypothetical protein
MADALADIEPRVTGLGPHVGEQLRGLRPDLHAWVLATIRASMKDQGRSLTGGQGSGLELGVETAVDAFVEAVAEPARDLTRTWSVFHTLGRTEHREGHRVDALRAILTVGARGIWTFLTEHAGTARLSPDELYVLAAALFGYIDTLAGAAAEGYLDEQRDAAHDWTSPVAGCSPCSCNRILPVTPRCTPPPRQPAGRCRKPSLSSASTEPTPSTSPEPSAAE